MAQPEPRLPGAPTTYPAPEVPEPPTGCRMEATKGDDMRYHGAVQLRGVNPPRSTYYDQGRFGRLFPLLKPFAANSEHLHKIGEPGGLMDGGEDNPENPDIPAGFTFLGQFLDHDITFDPTSSLERQSDPEAVRNFRTPALELDSVYGAGPGANPHLYQRGNRNKLLLGHDTAGNENDLPRNSEEVALLGDPRNDENLIVSQLHLAFLKFHNEVVDNIGSPPPGSTLFDEAQRTVRWHYQWMIVHEFLPMIAGEAVVTDVLENGRKFYKWRHEPFMPVEFSVGAYRFGHSQARPGYAINGQFGRPFFAATPSPPGRLPNDLSGSRRIFPEQAIDWHRFFKIDQGDNPQASKAIDTRISPPLLNLPFATGTTNDPKSLATRNLLRHLTFELPTGQRVAKAMKLPVLEPSELADLKEFGLDEATPLWFYILREADRRADGGKTLGPVGGRIVAEVFLGLLDGDRLSYRRADPLWQPTLGINGAFGIADLLRVAGVI